MAAAEAEPDLAPGHAMGGFGLSMPDFSPVGTGLRRPECVLATSCGDLYVSDERGGVTRIPPDGPARLFSGRTADGPALAANGFALLADGSFLIAPLAGGGVFRLRRNGQAEPFLQEVDGRPLSCPNFVLLDHGGRVWICCLTQQDRATISCYPRQRRDGYLVLVDEDGARIAADGIGYPNEIRIDPAGRYLYTNETMAGLAAPVPHRPKGGAQVGRDDSRVRRVEHAGRIHAGQYRRHLDDRDRVEPALVHDARRPARLLIEDACEEQLARLTEMQQGTGVLRSILYEEHSSTLRNISSLAFGGPDLMTAYLGSLMGSCVLAFRSPVAGQKPAHWDFGPFG